MERLTSRKNPVAIHLKKLGSSREYRTEYGQFLCDGIKLLEDAVKSAAGVVTVLTSRQIPFSLPAGATVYEAPRDLIDSLSPLKNAQDILFACRIPTVTAFTESPGTHILLDSIQDPGNVGTIIRTANAFGIKSVILMGECADPYNPKTVRATMGAVFRQRMHYLSVPELSELVKKGAKLVGAALGERNISEVGLSGSIIAVGSEGRGLSDEVLAVCSERITIPIAPECESLNAATAAAVLMWEASKQR